MGASLLASAASTVGTILFAQDEGFWGSPLFFVVGAVVLLGLCGAFYYLRSKQSDE